MSTRRSFMTVLTSMAALPFAHAAAQSPAPRAAANWDLTWLDAFKGRHKQVFDAGSFDLKPDTPLRVPMNYFETFRDVYQLEPPDINVAIGIARTAFPINASDALWAKYKLGELWGIDDPATKQPATRNIYLGDASGRAEPMVRALQARGAVFWQCDVALGAVAFQLSRAAQKPVDEMRAELVAGLNPGVRLVPSHTMAVGLAQEHGLTYEKL